MLFNLHLQDYPLCDDMLIAQIPSVIMSGGMVVNDDFSTGMTIQAETMIYRLKKE